jgi:hypothetical protein
MVRALVAAFVIFGVFVRPAQAQEGEPIGKAINLGPLADYFTLVSGLVYDEQPGGYRITLKLQAKKDVDTTDLVCQAGYFDRTKHLLQASPLMFQANFMMLKGETVNAGFVYVGATPEEGAYPWHTIVIRPGKKPN